jgi:HEAT repeat protein
VLPLRSGFFRWTAAQQATFAKTLTELSRDEARDTPTLLATIDQLSALPDVPPARLLDLADARNPKQAVRDAALRALGRLDGGRGVPALLDALQDDRARVAIYALCGALLAMPASRALELLRGVPTDKVTVAKEVVRLLGELGTTEAWDELMATSDRRTKLHRDVHVALLRALWGFLDRPRTWDRLYAAAAHPDPDVAAGVVRVPPDRLDAEGQRRLAGLLARLLEHADAKLRVDVLKRVAQLPVSDPARTLMPGLLRSMASAVPDESAAAASAVFATYAGREARYVGEAVRR